MRRLVCAVVVQYAVSSSCHAMFARAASFGKSADVAPTRRKRRIDPIPDMATLTPWAAGGQRGGETARRLRQKWRRAWRGFVVGRLLDFVRQRNFVLRRPFLPALCYLNPTRTFIRSRAHQSGCSRARSGLDFAGACNFARRVCSTFQWT